MWAVRDLGLPPDEKWGQLCLRTSRTGSAVRLSRIAVAGLMVVLDPVPATVNIDVGYHLAPFYLRHELDHCLALLANSVIACFHET